MFRPHSLRSVRASRMVLRPTGGAGSPSALNDLSGELRSPGRQPWGPPLAARVAGGKSVHPAAPGEVG